MCRLTKHAMRGGMMVILSPAEYDGGEYIFDAASNKAPPRQYGSMRNSYRSPPRRKMAVNMATERRKYWQTVKNFLIFIAPKHNFLPMRLLFLFLILLITTINALCQSQHVSYALHINEEFRYSGEKPSKIVESDWNIYSNGPAGHTTIYVFDTAGRILTEEMFRENGTLARRETYNWDHKKNRLTSLILEGQNNYVSTWIHRWYQYDSSGCLTGSLDKNARRETIGSTFFTVNAQCNPVEALQFDAANELIEKETLEYLYKENKAIWRQFDNTDKLLNTGVLEISLVNAYLFPSHQKVYNRQGDIVGSISAKKFSNQIFKNEYEYQYDSRGNWISLKIYYSDLKKNGQWTKGTIVQTKKRKIEYPPGK